MYLLRSITRSASPRLLLGCILTIGILSPLDAARLEAHSDHRTIAVGVELPHIARSDSADVAATVARFHAALAAGDSAAALSLLAPDALIVESGDVQTRAEYRAHHLPADIAFAAAVPSTRRVVDVTVRGDVAWVTATSVTQGDWRGRPINSAGAELTVLSRTKDGWLIQAVHWSSHARR
ncbi:hypothetical protein BH09GEM1_BH09GEM1_19770 [soil metagenome]